MQQNRITILCTKLVDEALIQDAESKNIFIDVLPFIKTELVASEDVTKEVVQISVMESTVVFTSINAVEAVSEVLKGHKPAWKIYCTGHATLRSVVKNFGTSLVSGTADNATDLAEVIIKEKGIDRIIFFCGDQRRHELPDMLKANKIEVNEVVVYHTVLTPHTTDRNYDGILFFSSSAVKSFFQKNKLNDQTVLFAIGNTTANEIKNYSGNKVVVSEEPDRNSILKRVIHYFETNPIHN
jgi:uroporphyrinogen-III synthase